MKLTRKTLTLAGAAAAAGALAVTGITSAAAQPAQPYIHVSLITTNPANRAGLSVIVTGSINDGGVDHQGSGNVDQLVFSQGGFTLWHSQGTGTPRFNQRTCVASIALNGTYRLYNGTGAYKGVTGHGIYRVNLTEVATRTASGSCSRHGVAAFQEVIKAQGPVSR
jgi:hypothetical protein